MSTPSDTIRTATSQGSWPRAKFRLGVADRPVGIVASRVWPHRRGRPNELATASGLPLWGSIAQSLAVQRAAEGGAAPPAGPFAALARALAELVAA